MEPQIFCSMDQKSERKLRFYSMIEGKLRTNKIGGIQNENSIFFLFCSDLYTISTVKKLSQLL